MVQDTQALLGELRASQASIKAMAESLANVKVQAIQLGNANYAVQHTYARTKAWRDTWSKGGFVQGSGYVPPAATQELLAQPVLLPSPFLEDAVKGFREKVMEYKKVMADLEQAFALSRANDPVDLNFLQSIPTILGNLHDYFIHVAAKIDKQHEQLQRMKAAYVAAHQARGDYGNPFERLRRQQQMLSVGGNSSSSSGAAPGGKAAAAAMAAFGGSFGGAQGLTMGAAGGAGGGTAGALVPVAGGTLSFT